MTTRTGGVRAIASTVATAAVVLASGASAAEPLTEVIVEAPRLARTIDRSRPLGAPIELASIRYRVSYADLDLATPAGARTLEERINEAARRACKEVEASLAPNEVPLPNDPPCVKSAVDGAMKQARAAIAAAGRNASK